ncbi:hypothetical protein [uncultured Tolumonas sp.]|uniref:hypothetical protein n=1 Tax=uncultured Tolumonas sp. TaxID=263765 RepID=UPI002A0A39CF|nr:hypothetical protein [uncultured Tolumonas sp.]
MEIFKSILPVITFLLGLIFVPLIEKRKDKYKTKRVHDNFVIDLSDEINNIAKDNLKIAEALNNIKNYKLTREPQVGTYKFVPRPMRLYFLADELDCNFAGYDKFGRETLKSMFVQVDYLNNLLKIIAETPHETFSIDVLEKYETLYKKYIFTSLSLRYGMRFLIKKVSKSGISLGDKVIVENQIKELSLNIDYHYLTTKSESTG